MIKEDDVICFENNKKAIVVKILDESEGLYYCIYRQNRDIYVVTEFSFSNNNWTISNETGRVIKSSEWSHQVRKLKENL